LEESVGLRFHSRDRRLCRWENACLKSIERRKERVDLRLAHGDIPHHGRCGQI
jgi:hypothetical protein